MDNIDTSEQIWKGKVIRYRKWEQRHDRSVDPLARKNYGKILAELYVDLSNTAREIVKRTTKENGARWTDTEKPLRDETWTTVYGSHRYTLKHTHEEPTRIWFQRHEHEPWFDLGYWNDKEGCFQDVPVDRDVVMRNRAIDINRSRFMGSGTAIDLPFPDRSDHIHIGPGVLYHAPMPAMGWTNLGATTEGSEASESVDMNSESPEALEAAAAHAMARAAELRAIDAWEPTGEEATISWTWADSYEGARTYTFVAFRTDDGLWYATGNRICRDGVKWRELATNRFGAALKVGNFHIVNEWGHAGGDES